ncbi:MAG: DUF4406 domain-containing protein [Spirochaetaceae bacterium]|nr:DUF4406 domain-containing protein [Spirochaetaceae bacterium]
MTYISGPITGVDGWQERFIQAENWVKENLDKNIKSPRLISRRLELGRTTPGEIPWEEYMRADLRALTWCDTIFVMRGSEGSKGAALELHLAQELGLRVCHQEDVCQG